MKNLLSYHTFEQFIGASRQPDAERSVDMDPGCDERFKHR